MPDKSKTNKASKFRMMRPAQGEYYPYAGPGFTFMPEGSTSTHVSSVFESDGKYFVAPTITNKKAPYAGYQPQSFKEASAAGEAIPFDTFEEALQFSKTYKLPNIMKQYNNGGKTPKKKPALLQYDPSSGAFGTPAYDLDTYQKAITRDSLALEGIMDPGVFGYFGFEENPLADFGVGSQLARQLQINRSNRDQIKGYTAEDIQRMNYYMPEKPTTNFDEFLRQYQESGIDDRAYGGKAPKYPDGGKVGPKNENEVSYRVSEYHRGKARAEDERNEYRKKIKKWSEESPLGIGEILIEGLFGPYAPFGNPYKPEMDRTFRLIENYEDSLRKQGKGVIPFIDAKAMGGKADVDYEAEGGEVVIGDISVNKAYNGGMATKYKGANMYKLGGPSHADGGIGIKMHGGEPSYVFTDRLKVGGMKGATYADMASKFGNELDEINQMAMGGDVYDRNTAKRMSPRIMADVKDLYDDQEAFKKEQGIDQETDKAFLGGLLKKGVSALETLGAGAGLGPLGVAATMLPGALNVAKGLFGRKPEVDLGTVEPIFQDYQDFSPMEQRFLNQQDRSLAQLQASLGASGATGQQLRAGLQAGQAGTQAGASQFYNQLGAMEMQNQAQVDAYNIQQQQQADMQNMQLRAQEAQMEANLDPMQSLGKGFSQIMGTVTSLGQQEQKMKMFDRLFPARYGGQFGLRKKY